MKVESVSIKMKDKGTMFRFGEQAYPDLHYIVRDGMAVVNYADSQGGRTGFSVPIEDIEAVSTSTAP